MNIVIILILSLAMQFLRSAPLSARNFPEQNQTSSLILSYFVRRCMHNICIPVVCIFSRFKLLSDF